MDIFEALEAGVDVFDGSYPTKVHSLNAANNLCSCLHAQHAFVSIECFHFHWEQLCGTVPWLHNRLPYSTAEKGLALHLCGTDDWQDGTSVGPQLFGGLVDVYQPRCAEQLSPIVPDCCCYTCHHHTLSYVHHLLTTKELLANVLLMM